MVLNVSQTVIFKVEAFVRDPVETSVILKNPDMHVRTAHEECAVFYEIGCEVRRLEAGSAGKIFFGGSAENDIFFVGVDGIDL